MYLYLTYWFPQRQLAHAIAIFNTGNPVANVIGAPLSCVILDHIHWLGLKKDWVMAELAREEQQKLTAERITVGQTLAHGRVWHLTSIYFMAMIASYSMIFWMPQLLKSLSSQYSNSRVGMLVMIPYVVALAAMAVVGRSSDRRHERRYHAAIPLIIGALGLVVLGTATTSSPW